LQFMPKRRFDSRIDPGRRIAQQPLPALIPSRSFTWKATGYSLIYYQRRVRRPRDTARKTHALSQARSGRVWRRGLCASGAWSCSDELRVTRDRRLLVAGIAWHTG
jgi:hypothetical protein